MGNRWNYEPWIPEPKPALLRRWGSKRSNRAYFRTESDDHAWSKGFRFSQKLVDHFTDFARTHCRYVRGSKTGEPVELLDWQIDEIIGPLLGWVDQTTGMRRHRRAYVELTKKQGKTTIASLLALYSILGDGEGGAVCISNGPTQIQAGLAWDIAADMVEMSPTLEASIQINRHKRLMRVHYGKDRPANTWAALAHSTTGRGSAQGFDASFVLNDELHEWPNWEHWRQVTKAGLARKQPIMLSITNAGLSKEGPCWAEHEYACRVLNSEIVDVSFHGYVRQTDEEAAENEIDAVGNGSCEIPVAKAANPAIGQIVAESEIVRDIREAFHTPGERGNCLRLTYSVWRTYGDSPWIGHQWDDCEDKFDASDCAGNPCWVGLDVAAVHDFTAAAFVFAMDDETFRCIVHYWLSKDRMIELCRVVPGMESWAKDGWMHCNAGATTDHSQVRDDLTSLINKYRWKVGETEHIPQLVYDPRMAEVITKDVEDNTGCDRVEFTQTSQNYHHPCEILETLVGDSRLKHNGNPILAFHANNVRVHKNTAEHKRPVRPGKDSDHLTIDGVVALIMALSQSDRPLPRQLDYYENNEIEMF